MCVCFRLSLLSNLVSPAPLSWHAVVVRPSVRPSVPPRKQQQELPDWLASCQCLPPVCPSEARVNPGQLSSPTWTRPRSGCLPQSAYTLAEAEGGSAAGAVLRHGLPHRNRIGSVCPLKLFSFCLCYVTAWSHSMYAHSRQGRAQGRGGEDWRAQRFVC